MNIQDVSILTTCGLFELAMKLVAYLTLQLLTLKKKYKILKAAAARRRAANADLVILQLNQISFSLGKQLEISTYLTELVLTILNEKAYS
jgi:hypothetical protein